MARACASACAISSPVNGMPAAALELQHGMACDLGGVAKGYIVQRGLCFLQQRGFILPVCVLAATDVRFCPCAEEIDQLESIVSLRAQLNDAGLRHMLDA